MRINFFVFCLPLSHSDFFHICMIFNTVICLLGLTFIFNSSFPIIAIGLICFLNIGISMNSLYSFYETKKSNLRANKIYALGQVPLWIAKIACFAVFRAKNFTSSNIYALLVLSASMIMAIAYYIYR